MCASSHMLLIFLRVVLGKFVEAPEAGFLTSGNDAGDVGWPKDPFKRRQRTMRATRHSRSRAFLEDITL
jgi:hypothetical protein